MIKAQIPFDFVANGKMMPAGECVITLVGTGRAALSINSGSHHAYAVPIVDEAINGKQTALIFHEYGDRYFLAGIKRAGSVGYQLPASRLEAELRARNVPEQDFTLLASAK
jgi:hypothetical protein